MGGGGKCHLVTPGPGLSVRDAPPRARSVGTGQGPASGVPPCAAILAVTRRFTGSSRSFHIVGQCWELPGWGSPSPVLPTGSPAPLGGWGLCPLRTEGAFEGPRLRSRPAGASLVCGRGHEDHARAHRSACVTNAKRRLSRRWQRRSARREDAGRSGRCVPPRRSIKHHPRATSPRGQTGHVLGRQRHAGPVVAVTRFALGSGGDDRGLPSAGPAPACMALGRGRAGAGSVANPRAVPGTLAPAACAVSGPLGALCDLRPPEEWDSCRREVIVEKDKGTGRETAPHSAAGHQLRGTSRGRMVSEPPGQPAPDPQSGR